MTDPNLGLMTLIRTKWGAQIAAACANAESVQGNSVAVPESFLAALVANETGGDATKTRFESNDFSEMCEVMAAKRAHFQNLGAIDLLSDSQQETFTLKMAFTQLVNYSTSWGLTQIMGYQTIPFHRTVSSLMVPADHLKFAGVLLVQFANRWDLSLGDEISGPGKGPGAVSPAPANDLENSPGKGDWEKLFACWNCGEPFPEKTFDPHYCANGMLRMSLYAQTAPPALELA